MRVATWCIDGINSHLKYLCHWLGKRQPDIVALQKTYTATHQFPEGVLRQAGYEPLFHSRDGEFRNGWGVAVLCRMTRSKPEILQAGLPGQEDPGARLLTVRTGDLEFSSVYALYGNPGRYGVKGALERKIAWMKRLHDHLGGRSTRSGRCILAGDFNVVSEGEPLRGVLNYTQAERDVLDRVLDLGFADLYRLRHPHSRKGCNYGFDHHKPASARLHRILGSRVVADSVCEAWVDLEYRKEVEGIEGHLWAQSAPVIVDLSRQLD